MQTAPINASASGDNAIVHEVPGRRIRVLGYFFVVAGAVTVTWRSATNALTGPMSFAANSGACVYGGAGTSLDPMEKIVTNAGEALNLNLGGAVQVGGHITYDVIS